AAGHRWPVRIVVFGRPLTRCGTRYDDRRRATGWMASMSSINAAHDPALAWPEDGQIGAARSGRPLTSSLSLAALIVPAVILLGSGLLAGAPPKGDDIEQGVTIGDVSVSGGDWEKVGPKLQAAFDDFVQTPVRLVVAGNEIEVTPAELG